jgi:hypothetical protein
VFSIPRYTREVFREFQKLKKSLEWEKKLMFLLLCGCGGGIFISSL